MPHQMQEYPPYQPMLISYADVPSQYGLIVERSAELLSIKVPCSSLWRRPQVFVFGWIATLFITFFMWGAVLGAAGSSNGTKLSTPLSVVGLLGSVFLSAALSLGVIFLINRMSKTKVEAIFTVEDGFLSLTTWNEEGEATRRWPVTQIGNIRGNLYGMGLTIRITKTDMIELLHHHPETVRVWIADELRAAVGLH